MSSALDKFRNGYLPFRRKTLTMKLDSLDFV